MQGIAKQFVVTILIFKMVFNNIRYLVSCYKKNRTPVVITIFVGINLVKETVIKLAHDSL